MLFRAQVSVSDCIRATRLAGRPRRVSGGAEESSCAPAEARMSAIKIDRPTPGRRLGSVPSLRFDSEPGVFFAVYSRGTQHATREPSPRFPGVALWGEAEAPGGTVRRAAVRKRGSGSVSLS